MNLTYHTYRIAGRKAKTGELIEGTTTWDGLSSLHTVRCDDGTTRYLSVIDQLTEFERID